MKECQNIEFKETWSDDYLKWICGFANAQGGKLYIGVDDSENIVGVKNAKKLLEDIPNKIVTTLGIVAEVNLLKENTLEYIEIIVPPSSLPIAYRGTYQVLPAPGSHHPMKRPFSSTESFAMQYRVTPALCCRSDNDMFHGKQ